MASGWSRRFSGENKLLLPVDGKPMIRHTLEKLGCPALLERVIPWSPGMNLSGRWRLNTASRPWTTL